MQGAEPGLDDVLENRTIRLNGVLAGCRRIVTFYEDSGIRKTRITE
jgi:hypothetical protein